MRKDKIANLIKEYEPIRQMYKDFSFTIKFILENILSAKGFKYQVVACRGKSIQSLQGKLESPNNPKSLEKINSVTEIDDLAGCRIVFYLDGDIQRFVNCLYNEFKVIKQNLKYSEDDYNALHVVVKLNNNRLKLSEYSSFKGLKCEVQLTTVLFHAWSELAHDVIYKAKNELSEFDKNSFDSIERNFADVMKNHIKQAQHYFDYVFKEIERIKEGKEIFDVDFLRSILDSKNNNELLEKLKLLLKHVEKYGDKTPKEAKITEIISKSLQVSKTFRKEPIKTALGEYQGYDYSNIVAVCLDIINILRYVHLKEVFYILCELSIEQNTAIEKKTIEVIANLSKYVFWPKEKKVYYQPQLMILDIIEKWNNEELLKYYKLIMTVVGQLLCPSFEGTSWKDPNAFVLHQGALPASKVVEGLRTRAINLLQRLYVLSGGLQQKRNILKVFYEASQPPMQGGGEALDAIILKNVNDLILFYLAIVNKADNEIIKSIEEQLNWFKRKYQTGLTKIEELESSISNNKGYQVYKVFVGYDYKYSEDRNWEESGQKRKQIIQEYINQISDDNFLDWQSKILLVINNYNQTEDTGQYQYFNMFLNELGKQKPDIAQRLIYENEKVFEPFLAFFISGIWQSNQKELAKHILQDWLGNGKHLSVCAYVFVFVREIDKEIIEGAYQKAVEVSDINALSRFFCDRDSKEYIGVV